MLKDIAKTQKSILRELKYIRKNKSSGLPKSSNSGPITSVMFNGIDLTLLGHNNLEPTIYAELIARRLFTDEEMSKCMLFPIREHGARKPLSPTRSSIFKRAVQSRFRDDEDALKSAISAVNQLGNDIKRGRRKRRQSYEDV